MKSRILVLFVFFLWIGNLEAANRITTGAGGNWSNAGTWAGAMPGPGDNVQIASGATLTVDVDVTCLSLEFHSSNAVAANTTLNINPGVTLTISSGITFRDPTPNVNCTQLVNVGGGNLNVGTTIVYGNTDNANEINRVTVGAGNLVVTGQVNMAGATNENYLELTGSGTIKMGDISANGTFTVTTGQNNSVWYTGDATGFRSVNYDNLYIQIPTTGAARTRTTNAVVTVNGNLVIESLNPPTLATLDASNALTVLGTTTIKSGGRFSDNDNTGVNTFTGKVTIENGGVWLTTGLTSPNLIFKGGIQHDNITAGTFWADYAQFSTNPQTISGAGFLLFDDNVVLNSIDVTNMADSVRITGTLDGTLGSEKWINGTGAALNYDNTTNMFNTNGGTLDASAVDNSVWYGDGGNQTILNVNYYTLGTAGGGNKTMQAGTTIAGNLIIYGGTLLSGTFSHQVAGNIICNGSHTPSTGTYTLNGTSTQVINGTTNPIPFNNLIINNTAGVSLAQTTRVTNILTLTNGLFTLNNKDLQLTNTGAAISGTPDATKMIFTNGTGSLVKSFSGASAFNFPVGTNTGSPEYTPLSMNLTNTTGTQTLSVRVTKGIAPNNTSGNDYMNRYWTVATPITSSMTATCNYITPTDVIGDEANCKGAYWNGATWTKNATFLSTSPGSFAVGPTNFSTVTSITGVDGTLPIISNLHIVADNPYTNSTFHNDASTIGTTVLVSFTANKAIWIQTPTIGTFVATTLDNGSFNYVVRRTLAGTETETATLPFSFSIVDYSGNACVANPIDNADIIDASKVAFDKTPINNASSIFSANQSQAAGSSITLNKSSVTATPAGLPDDQVWFAPASGTYTSASMFNTSGGTMTFTNGSSTTITAPAVAGTYKIYVVDYAGNVSAGSASQLTNPPSITNVAATAIYMENTPPVAMTISNTTILGASSGSLTSATISITVGYVNGSDILDCATPGTLVKNFNAGTGVLTLTGNATLAVYQTALQSVTFVNNQHPPVDNSTRTITWVVSDGTPSNTATTMLTVKKFNNAPIFLSAAPLVANEWTVYSYTVEVQDDIPASLIFSLIPANTPSWLTFGAPIIGPTSTQIVLSGTPTHTTPRSTSVVINVFDGSSNVQQAFTLTVSLQFNVPGHSATINGGIALAIAGDRVQVGAGVHAETVNFSGNNVEVRGDPSVPSNVTIDATGLDASVVTFETNENSNAILDGFTIKGGSGNLKNLTTYSQHSQQGNYGGGIYCFAASPTIRNLIITGNVAKQVGAYGGSGGGVYCGNGAAPVLTFVTIITNTAEVYRGGGMCLDNSNPTLNNVNITNNSGGNYGGGMACFGGSTPVFNTVTVSGNSASGENGEGGGIYWHAKTAVGGVAPSGNTATRSGANTFVIP